MIKGAGKYVLYVRDGQLFDQEIKTDPPSRFDHCKDIVESTMKFTVIGPDRGTRVASWKEIRVYIRCEK